jgi:hypothetical protein
MAILLVSTAPSRLAYDKVDALTRMSSDRPDGLIVHAAAEQADGTVSIVDVWESESQMRTFEQDRLFPAFAGANQPMSNPPTPLETFELVKA